MGACVICPPSVCRFWLTMTKRLFYSWWNSFPFLVPVSWHPLTHPADKILITRLLLSGVPPPSFPTYSAPTRHIIPLCYALAPPVDRPETYHVDFIWIVVAESGRRGNNRIWPMLGRLGVGCLGSLRSRWEAEETFLGFGWMIDAGLGWKEKLNVVGTSKRKIVEASG